MQQLYSGLLLGFSLSIFEPVKMPDSSFDSYLSSPKANALIILAENIEAIESKSPTNLFQQLNLTPLQKRKIGQIRLRYQSKIAQLRQDLRLAQQQLASMMAGTDSVELVRAKHKEIANFRQQLGTLHFESMLATREVLSPEQRRKFAEIIQGR